MKELKYIVTAGSLDMNQCEQFEFDFPEDAESKYDELLKSTRGKEPLPKGSKYNDNEIYNISIERLTLEDGDVIQNEIMKSSEYFDIDDF